MARAPVIRGWSQGRRSAHPPVPETGGRTRALKRRGRPARPEDRAGRPPRSGVVAQYFLMIGSGDIGTGSAPKA